MDTDNPGQATVAAVTAKGATAVNNWCLIESDPGVFTEMISGFGCTGAQVEEIWSMNADAFRHLEPIHGLIFLFKWMDNKPAGRVVTDRSDIFFARQVVTNACATQALICLLLNLQHEDIDLGPILSELKIFCQDLCPDCRGQCLAKEERIRKVHNSFARPELFVVEDSADSEDVDCYHFVGFMPIKGKLYELDGMKEGPIELGEIGQHQNWLDVVRPIIEGRMKRYSVGEIHFNLMALVSDRQRCYERQIQMLVELPSPLSYADCQAEIATLISFVKLEKEKKRRYRKENIRRRHNYLPFIVELLKQLGETGQLLAICDKAKDRSCPSKPNKDAMDQQPQ
uniref:Ubiquitin carboxyl-terminal hydrolase n=1 Tax=Drosophila simulans TaxID=7240 RepID=B4F526_DROSI|nr:CG1950-PA [Drosophila simulans]